MSDHAPVLESELDLPLLHRGKVRDVYEIDAETLFMVASDRVSAFDVVLPQPIPFKGEVLTLVTAWWLERLGKRMGHHLIAVDPLVKWFYPRHQLWRCRYDSADANRDHAEVGIRLIEPSTARHPCRVGVGRTGLDNVHLSVDQFILVAELFCGQHVQDHGLHVIAVYRRGGHLVFLRLCPSSNVASPECRGAWLQNDLY